MPMPGKKNVITGTGKARCMTAFLITTLLLLAGCNGSKSRTVTDTAGGKSGTPSDRYAELIVRSNAAEKFTVYFLDLDVSPQAEDKSGDAALLIAPDGTVMMVDSGHPESAPDILAFLKDLGIGRIDYFLLSHPHIDHIGGFPAIAEKHEVGAVYHIDMEYTTDTFLRYRQALEKYNIPVTILKRGDALKFGNGIDMEVFNPETEWEYPQGFPANSTQFINNHSLVIKFSYGASTLLMGGDIYNPRERDLVDLYGERLKADVLKANHHGNDTSNSLRWIKTIQPQCVIAMNDVIGSMTVYNNYKRNGAAFYHTLHDGIVKVSMDDKRNYTLTTRYDSWLRDEAISAGEARPRFSYGKQAPAAVSAQPQ
jgi:competence protein ComEC